jgi:hypothetical protein
MKISRLINKLQKIKKAYGDVDALGDDYVLRPCNIKLADVILHPSYKSGEKYYFNHSARSRPQWTRLDGKQSWTQGRFCRRSSKNSIKKKEKEGSSFRIKYENSLFA